LWDVKNKRMSFIIRKGELNDLAQVLELIQELSVIEYKIESEITIYDLIRDGFSNKEYFNLFVAELGEEIIGFSIYHTAYSRYGKSMIIEEVFVTKAYKNKGIGLSLFSKNLEYANDKKIKQLEWAYNEGFPSLKLLYERAGAKILETTSAFSINKEVIYGDVDDDLILKDDIFIREGVQNDAYNIMLLMAQSNLEKGVFTTLTINDIIADGFSEAPLYGTFVLEFNDKIIGYILFCDAYSIMDQKTLNIADSFVKEEYKGSDFESLLYKQLVHHAKINQYNKISFLVSDFDKNHIKLCNELGAKRQDGVRIVRIEYQALCNFINS